MFNLFTCKTTRIINPGETNETKEVLVNEYSINNELLGSLLDKFVDKVIDKVSNKLEDISTGQSSNPITKKTNNTRDDVPNKDENYYPSDPFKMFESLNLPEEVMNIVRQEYAKVTESPSLDYNSLSQAIKDNKLVVETKSYLKRLLGETIVFKLQLPLLQSIVDTHHSINNLNKVFEYMGSNDTKESVKTILELNNQVLELVNNYIEREKPLTDDQIYYLLVQVNNINNNLVSVLAFPNSLIKPFQEDEIRKVLDDMTSGSGDYYQCTVEMMRNMIRIEE